MTSTGATLTVPTLALAPAQRTVLAGFLRSRHRCATLNPTGREAAPPTRNPLATMARTTLTANLPDGTTATRRTERTYSHVVAVGSTTADGTTTWAAWAWAGNFDLAEKQARRLVKGWNRAASAKYVQVAVHVLPIGQGPSRAYNVTPGAGAAAPAEAQRPTTRTAGPSKAWVKFQGAPARLAKDMDRSIRDWGTTHPSAAGWAAVAAAARAVTAEELAELFAAGARTAWDLQCRLERRLGIRG